MALSAASTTQEASPHRNSLRPAAPGSRPPVQQSLKENNGFPDLMIGGTGLAAMHSEPGEALVQSRSRPQGFTMATSPSGRATQSEAKFGRPATGQGGY